MLATLRSTGELLISIANNSHPFLEGFANAKFRSVHDWHHVVTGADSTFTGELATFEHAAKHAPKEIKWMLFSEIVLQASACIATGRFQPQKLVRMPGL
jgi:ubiquinone biosynthesis protein Coq4